MEEALYKKVQEGLDENSDAIGKLFQDALTRLKADAGFFGYEDLEGYIRIFKCKGRYLHLPKDQGFTGTVYNSRKGAIYDMKGSFEDTTGSVKAEMAAPVLLDDKPVGVILVDRLTPAQFTVTDLNMLISYGERLGAILSKREPWPFRKWWETYESRRINEYRDGLMPKLVSILKDLSNISAFTALVEGRTRVNIVDLKPIESEKEKVTFKGRITDEVISSGVGVLHPEKVTRGEIAVPFPHLGPIKGVIWVEIYVEPGEREGRTELSTVLLNDIEQAVESTEFSYFAKTPEHGDPSARFYSIFMKCASRGDLIGDIVEEVIDHTRALCDTDVHIFLAKEIIDKTLKDTGVFYTAVSEKELRDRFTDENLKSFRPHFATSSDKWIKCPIWVDNDLVAGIEAKKKDESEVEYNGPILEVVSTALANAFQEHRRIMKMKELSELLVDSSSEKSELMKVISENARLILRANSFTIWDVQNREIHLLASSEKPHREKTSNESLMKVAQCISSQDVLVNIKNANDVSEFDNIARVNIGDLMKHLEGSDSKAIIARRVEIEPSHYVMFLACATRGKSFKSFFGIDDETTMNILTGLFLASTFRNRAA